MTQTAADVVVVVFAAGLRVALTRILHLPGHGIAVGTIVSVVQTRTVEQNTDGTQPCAGGRCCDSRVRRQPPGYIGRNNRVGVAVVGVSGVG